MRSLLSLSAAVLVLFMFSLAAPRAVEARGSAKALERRVIRAVNVQRAQRGLPTLWASRRLGRAARSHCADLALRGLLDHVSGDGTAMFDRVRRFFPARSVGETLAAVGLGRRTARTVVRMWMGSPPHRAVMLNRSFRHIGVGLRRAPFGSRRMIVVTADFAGR